MKDFTTNQPKNYNGIKGWLLFLCIFLIIGTPLKAIINLIITIKMSMYYGETGLIGIQRISFYFSALAFLSGILVIPSINAGISLLKKKNNAVKETKIYFYIVMGYSILLIILPYIIGIPYEIVNKVVEIVLPGSIMMLFISFLWLLYLKESRRIKATYSN